MNEYTKEDLIKDNAKLQEYLEGEVADNVKLRDQIFHLREENERLRGVLEDMAKDGCGCGPPSCIDSGKTSGDSCWSCMATRALNPSDGEEVGDE